MVILSGSNSRLALETLIVFIVKGILLETLITSRFINIATSLAEKCESYSALIIIPSLFALLKRKYIINNQHQNTIVNKSDPFLSASFRLIETYTFITTISILSYHIAFAYRISYVLSIACFTIIFKKSSQMKQQILYLFIGITIWVFIIFDVDKQKRFRSQQIIGMIMIAICIAVNYYSNKYKSDNRQQVTSNGQVNKYLFIISLILASLTFEINDILMFMVYHPQYSIRLFFFGVISVLEQLLVQKHSKQFKKTKLSLILVFYSIISMVANIVFYQHKIETTQKLGIAVMICGVLLLIMKKPENSKVNNDFSHIQLTNEEQQSEQLQQEQQ